MGSKQEWAKKGSSRKSIKEENENLMDFDWDDTELIKAFEKAMKTCAKKEGKIKTINIKKEKRKNLMEFDWDDTELIKAFDIGMNKCAKKEGKCKAIKKGKRMWRKGDFCRAVFPEDNLLYEARILSINGDFCTVEFLGYDDLHDVDLCTLKESLPKRVPGSHFENSVTESEVDESTSIDSKSTYCKKEQYDGNLTNVCPSSDDRRTKHHGNHRVQPNVASNANPCLDTRGLYMPPAPYFPSTTSLSIILCTSNMSKTHESLIVLSHLHIPCPPPVPPMPQSPVFEHNPNLSAMMVSWYMAGYYTGLNASSQNSQCFQHNSGRGRQRYPH
ncbi:hypothetical protein CEXT_697621 [Caerostris extrusa]|uniref:Tudor domain-containing protein n=1 Tax=Caerostris extrusa TaxID=172846 RepID=A0AAV4NUP6_CAEEX|nr:hypothetical protein CEXT_697621 [Caerostris extrusa]